MEDSSPPKPRLTTWIAAFVIFIVLSPVYFIGARYFGENRAFVVYCVTGTFLLVTYMRRDLLLNMKFLAAMVCLYLIHLAVMIYIPLPAEFAGVFVSAACILDLIIVDAIAGKLKDMWDL